MSQGRLPVDGVALIVEGQRKFIDDLNQVNAAWNKTISGFDKADTSTSKASGGLDRVGKSAARADSGLLTMAAGIGIAVAGFNILLQTLGKVATAITDTMMESLQLAGQFQEMEFAALAIGRAMGLTEAEIRGASQEIQDLGIRADVANKTVAQFARNQLDLAKATDLVRIAQATGIIINEDSSATMESLTRAITTGSTIMLRRMGIMVDNSLIEQRLAKDLGVTTGELGQQAVMMARTNAIIEASASLLDVYDAAMESPTKRLRSWTGRLLPELQAALGAPFLDAWSTLIQSVSSLTKALTAAISEGGALFPLMIKLGAAASIMADGIAAAFNAITKQVTDLSDDIGTGVEDTIEQALRWGVELIAAFATGMAEAASTVLVQAMNFISGILSSWLLGASPPKIAPGIVGWGINLMQMYLEGMTQADFGILKDIQGPLKKILSGPAFAAISKTLAGALAGDDRGKFLETIGKAAGVFTDAVTKLAVANFDLADSVVAVQEAEDALAKSREKILDSQGEVNEATAEYNRLLRAGAAETQLQAQLGLINAAEANLRTSLDQVDVQEDAIKTAKERQSQLEAEEKLQQDVVDQLLDVNAALIVQEKEEKKLAKAKKGKLFPPELEAPIAAVFDISSRIGDAVKAMKQQIKDQLKDIFAPLRDAFEQDWEPALDAITASWNQLRFNFVEFMSSEQGQAIRDFFSALFPEGTVEAIGAVSTAFLLIAGALGTIGIIAAVVLSPLGLLAAAVLLLSGLWAGHNEQLIATADQISILVRHYATELGLLEDENATTWAAIQQVVSNSFQARDDLREQDKQQWRFFFANIGATATMGWQMMLGGWQDLSQDVGEVVSFLWENMKGGWEQLSADVIEIVSTWAGNLITEYNQLITDATAGWTQFWADVTEIIQNPLTVFNSFVDAVKGFHEWLKGKSFNIKLPNLSDLNPFISDSPSPLGKGLKEINQQLQVLATTRLPSLANMGTQMAGALSPSQMLSPVSNTNVTMNMGGNTFNSGTSEAAFNARVEQSMRGILRR